MITKKDCLAQGVLDYFPNALAAVGRHSRRGNEKYPPVDGSTELRWSFDVSTEHADAILSHLTQRGELDEEFQDSHTVGVAWRALALLETELVNAGAKPGRAVVRSEEPEVTVELQRVPDFGEEECLARNNIRSEDLPPVELSDEDRVALERFAMGEVT